MAALLAWLFNSLALTWLGKKAIYTVAPITEEFLKTGLAYVTGSSLVPVHLTFGFTEAIFDILRPGKDDWPAGLVGLISHGFFGWWTQKLWIWTGSLLWGFLGAVFIHLLWNLAVVSLIRPSSGSKTG